jgi:hypothetical protein
MMRKLVLIVIGACIVVAIVLLVPSDRRQLSFASSPSNRYALEIFQTRFGIERYVYLKASRDGTVFLSGKLLYTGDFLDNDFNDLYPHNSWLTESIVKIGQPDGDSSDKLHISNGSRQVKYLLLETYFDKFVLFEVERTARSTCPFIMSADSHVRVNLTGPANASVMRLNCKMQTLMHHIRRPLFL